MGAYAAVVEVVLAAYGAYEAHKAKKEQEEAAEEAKKMAAKQVPAAPPGQPNEPVVGVRDVTPGSTLKKRRLGTKRLQYQPNILTIPSNTNNNSQPSTGLGIPKAR